MTNAKRPTVSRAAFFAAQATMDPWTPYRMLPTPGRFVVMLDAMGGRRFFCIHPRADREARCHHDVSTTGALDLAWVSATREDAEKFLAVGTGGNPDFPGRPRAVTIGRARCLVDDARELEASSTDA